ncbi:hypothetical protein [Streptomyces sp. NPDC001297]|uniref:hypothetical protein n=1 Tax=Streptomyces sp. NPDC001297 TaxID=3364559 RepID=UPI0036C6677B
MAKANTRAIDRLIQTTERRLQGVRSGEISSLAAGEQARVFLHAGRGARRVMRGKSAHGPERAADRVFEQAEERLAAELAAAKRERQRIVSEAAAATVEKKTSGGWW